MTPDLTAERGFIGGLLAAPERFPAYRASGMAPELFRLPKHAEIFSALGAAHANGTPMDAGSIGAAVGDFVTVAALLSEAPVALNLDAYANEVRASAWAVRAIEAHLDVINMLKGRRPFDPLEAARSQIKTAAERIATDDVGEGAFSTPTTLSGLDDFLAYAELQMARQAEGRPIGIPTGIARLDAMTGGFYPGSYTILGARPSNGKSSVGVHFAVEAALAEAAVIYCTIEMRSAKIYAKALAKLTGISLQKINRGLMNDGDCDALSYQLERARRIPFRVNDRFRGSFERLEAELWRLHARGELKGPSGFGIVFVDYIQQFRMGGRRFTSRADEVTAMSSRLQALAQEFGVAIVAMAQLNRTAAGGKPEAMPAKHQLKESGSLEQDADMIMLLHRENEKDPTGAFTLILDKNRDGEQGWLELVADFERNRFHDTGGRR